MAAEESKEQQSAAGHIADEQIADEQMAVALSADE